MSTIPLSDAMFLLGESPGKPMHVIALQLFRPAPDTDLAAAYDGFLELLVRRTYRRRAHKSWRSPSTLAWADDGLDLDYHVRHVGLPSRGRVRELLELISLEHGVVLDRNRPLWQYHLIEGLYDGRFATAFKTHHAVADGMTLARHVLGGLSTDPEARDCLPPWAARGAESRAAVEVPPRGLVAGAVGGLKASTKAVQALREMAAETTARVPYQAPRSILNKPITGARRFAGDKWEHARLKAVATRASCTVNDVALAMCGGALRAYLQGMGELPEASLVAMVPISLRRPGEPFDTESGNAFGAILCDLATTTGSAATRLGRIAAAMADGKRRFDGLSTGEAIALSRIVMGGSALSSMAPSLAPSRPPFNLVISNVPAGSQPLYFNGAEMTDIYPVSMISEGQAMNITVSRYADTLNVGIVGDRTWLPHLQRMLVHLEDALVQLETEVA